MKKSICTTLLSAGLVLTGLSTKAQGLEGVIVEEFHTVTQADADFLNNDLGNSTFPIVAGSKVYRVYVDMAPNYRFLQVFSVTAANAADFSTTTTFWNDDNFGSEFPAQTRRASTGTLFDSYITIGSTGIAGGASPCGALGSALAQVGVLRSADNNGDLTSCGVFPGFTGNDGSIPGTVPAVTTNLSGALDFTALTGSGSSFSWINDSYATLPANTGVDPAGTNRVLIGQFTTDGVFSFHINVDISDPNNQIESYYWANPVAGATVSPFLTFPNACNAPVLGTPTSNGPICAGAALNLSASATGDATITYSWSGPNSFSSTQQNPTIPAATVAASGTYTVTASNGCAPDATATVNVVVNPSTTNTTTETACDSFTWSVNGTTYTQSGTYTSVNGCATETLVLTITPSTNNTTTVSECDSYTWAENGTTYTQSGTYTSVNGCATETLVLTITPSTNNTTTVSECDSYTWAENGVTYTQSGTYTNVVGCATETLVLTILQSGNNTTTESACDSFTWSVNGTTYTQSGTYTSVTGCSTETLVLTITPSTNNTTTVSECDSYTWAENGTTYTQSGTYTSVNGCATETLVLTITPSTNNTTTVSECDSYTWAENGVTYTQSGTFTNVVGCATETLVLTILQSGNNTTTESACDSFTWSVNGTTYTQSGTYTSVTGCSTETLVLTITPSTNNTTTVSECDSYTWSVNGVTYTQSGTYTNVVGCATETLVLTILQSGNNTTTESACDSFTWSVNGTTYTQSGTFTQVTGCSTETLVLTITPSTNNTTTETACSSFTWSVNGTTYTQSGTYTNVVGCATETLVLTVNIPGTACDDGDVNTINDQLDANCVCVGQPATTDCLGVIGGTALPGTPCDDLNASTGNDTWSANCQCEGEVIDCLGVIGGSALPGTPCNDNNAGTINDTWSVGCSCVGVPTGCTENIVLNITLDAFGSQNTWTLLQDGTGTVVEQGGPYSDGQASVVISEELCVPAGCYRLVVSDNAGDGIVGGGYVLLVSGTNARIIDNTANFSNGSTSSISGDQAFCLPIGTDRLIASNCDKLDWVNGQYMVASPNPAVSAEWIVGGSNAVQDANSGYEFWIFDPNGSYSFRRFRSHNVSDGFGPASATRAAHMKINNWAVANQVPANVLMNVRVRSRVNGVNAEFGPACRMVIDPVLAACPQTQLMNIAGNQFFSCGSTRQYGNGNYVHARPVSGANRYQFRFRQPGTGFEVVRTATTYFVQLNWTVNPLVAGETYEVEVRVSKNGGATWCTEAAVWGPVCSLTIGLPAAQVGFSNFAAEAAAELRMFPNPNRGDLLNVSLSAVEEGVNTVEVDIFDLFGKRVSARTIAVNDGMINTVLDLNGELAAGMYMVNITAGETLYTERLMIQP